MRKLKGKEVKKYFSAPQTVSAWWLPEDGLYNFHYDQELRILEEHFFVDSGWAVLDAGCGKGRFGIWFAKKCSRVLAMDISLDMLGINRERSVGEGIKNIDFFASDIEDISLKQEKLDVVSCMEVIDHLPDLDKGISSLAEVLKGGGYLLTTYTASNSIYGMLRYIFTVFAYIINGESVDVSNIYSIKQVGKMLERYNIKIDKVFGVGLFTFPQERVKIPAFINRILLKISRWDICRKPYYTHPFLASRCSSVVLICRKNAFKT